MLLTGTIKSDRIIIIRNRIFYNSFADSNTTIVYVQINTAKNIYFGFLRCFSVPSMKSAFCASYSVEREPLSCKVTRVCFVYMKILVCCYTFVWKNVTIFLCFIFIFCDGNLVIFLSFESLRRSLESVVWRLYT